MQYLNKYKSDKSIKVRLFFKKAGFTTKSTQSKVCTEMLSL